MQGYTERNYILLNFFVTFSFFGDISTKSETYQKEGWFILEEENQVFGKDAEAVDNNKNLESEDFYFYHQNKEEAKKNIDNSSKDLTDFIDSLIQDVPAPSEEEINASIEKILKITHPEEEQPQTARTNKRKKVTFKVLFIAALLSILSVSCLFVVGSNHNISIENGFVAFAKDTIQIVFFGETKEEYITIDALLTDLEQHGYGDILFPQEFVSKSDEYKIGVPKYLKGELRQVSFDISNNNESYSFIICEYNQTREPFDYVNVVNMSNIFIEDIYVYISEFNDESTIDFVSKGFYCCISSNIPYSRMIEIAESLE